MLVSVREPDTEYIPEVSCLFIVRFTSDICRSPFSVDEMLKQFSDLNSGNCNSGIFAINDSIPVVKSAVDLLTNMGEGAG